MIDIYMLRCLFVAALALATKEIRTSDVFLWQATSNSSKLKLFVCCLLTIDTTLSITNINLILSIKKKDRSSHEPTKNMFLFNFCFGNTTLTVLTSCINLFNSQRSTHCSYSYIFFWTSLLCPHYLWTLTLMIYGLHNLKNHTNIFTRTLELWSNNLILNVQYLYYWSKWKNL